MSTDIHQIITDKIITALESAPADGWTCPWHRTGAGGFPKNAATKATYRGINIIALWIAGNAAGYTEPRWATYRQWSATGAQVRKGEKGTMVVFFKELSDDADVEKPGEGRRFVARASHVFNVAQVDGAEVQDLPAVSFDPIAEAERLAAGLGAPIAHGGDQACYLPSRDLVRMPPRERFHTRDGYYATLFHELGHNAVIRIMPRTIEKARLAA